MRELWNILFPDFRNGVSYAKPLFHISDSLNKGFCRLFVRRFFVCKLCFDSQLMKLLVNGRTIIFQHHGKDHRIGKAMGDIVFAAQGVSHGMDVAYIGFGKCAACVKGGFQHIFPGFDILAVPVGGVQIFKNQPDCFLGITPGIRHGGAADVSLYCVGEGIQACCGGDKGRQAKGCLGVQHGIPGNQRKVVDCVFRFLFRLWWGRR